VSSASDPIQSMLADIKHRVDAHLTKFFEQKREHARTLSAPSVELVDALAEFTMRGGKRTRPAILIAGNAAVADTDRDALLDACAGLELLQSYLLVHDDWMDQDAERRGGTTLHRLFAKRTGDMHLGASIAILAGDLGNAFATELVARSAAKSQFGAQALEVFWTMQRDVVYGQALDLIAYKDVSLIQRLKTGSYSVKGPLLLGAVLGGANAEQRAALEQYAEPAGLAFQMRDDMLGVFGAPEKTGKPAGNDLRAGKRTALIEEAEARLSEAKRKPLTSVLGQIDAPDGELAAAMELLVRSGAQAAVEARIDQLDQRAQAALRTGSLREPGRTHLEQLARMFAYRDH
jgi:geranylgeranyl diphosphate synthase, type I